MFGGQQQRTGFGFGAAGGTPAFGAQPTTGFGGFGAAAAAPAASASPFGAPAAASPFGGGANTTPAFGSAFGAPAATTGAFGAPAATTSTFGAPASTTSAFGAPAAGTPVGFGGFGTNTASSPFGAPAQPAASPFGAPASAAAASPFGGGMFGGTAAAKPTGFGGFGAAATSSTPSAFGAAAPAFGAPATSAFGAPSTLGGGGFGGTAFGAAPATASSLTFGSTPFGQPAPATTGAFGAPAVPTGFGGFGAAAAPSTGAALVGTGPPASYKPTSEQESEKGKVTTVHFQSISKMPEYQHKSVEELRWEDYLKRTDAAAAAAQAALVPNTGAAAPATNMFGQPAAAPSAFGKPPLGGGFGQATSATTTGGFGGFGTATAAPATNAFGFGSTGTSAFGATTSPATNNAFSFGSNTATTGTGGFGGFGSTPNAFGSTTTTNAFGSAPAAGGFGGFGSTPATAPSAFGTAQANTTTGGFGGFGAKPATTTSAFGTTTTGGFGSTTTGGFGGFTPAAAPAATTGGFGGFGSSTASGFGAAKPATTSAFGTSFGAASSAPSAFGGFGTSTQPQTNSAFSLGTSTQPGAASAFSFGKPATTTTSMFGSTPTTTSSFGSFGSGSTGSGFGTTAANTATNAGLFGGTSFGGGFGLSQPANTATQQQQQQPTTLFAGHDTNPYGAGSFGAGLIEKQIQTTLTLPVPSSGASQPSSLFSTPSPATTRSRDDRPVKPIATAAGLRFHTVAAKPSVLSVDKSSENASVTSFASSKFKSLATKQLTIATPPPKLHRPTDKPQVIPEAITLSFTIAKPDSTTRTIRWTGDADTTFDAVWPVVASQVKPAKLVRWRLSDGSRLDLHATVGSVDASAPIEVDVVDPADTSSSSDASAPSTTGLSFDSFYEKEKEKEEACRAINPLAPVLTKEGYYTLPDYASLCTMSTAELKAVDHFVVGCKGMGCVQWYGSTDVTGLNLDELVLFAPKEVIVYPNEDVKHPLGEGLNKPALVELLHIYPPSDPTRRAQYVNRVKTRTDHMDATFVDYQPEAGVWKFKVEHFSRYGFDDDEAHDNPQATASGSSALQTMASQLKLNPARLHQLHALYLANQPPTDVLSSSEAKDKPSIFGTLDSASTEVVSQTRLTVVEPAAPTPPAPSVPKRYAVPTLTCSTKSTVLALWNGPSTSTMDMGISMGRSFRGASFGPSGQLVVVTRHRQVRVHQHPLPSPATADSLPLLHVHQALSTTNAHTHHVELPTNMAAHIHEYADMAVSALPMWQLVLALFGLEHREGSTTPHPLSPSQRDEFISRWFELATRRSKSAADNTVLQALLQHNIVDAAERAMAQGNFRLAMVVAQAQSYESSTFRMQLQAQLSQWETQSASRHVDKELLEIYSLLAGSVGVVTQPATANSSMDWIQMLALVLWYHEGPTSLPRALAVYQSYVQQGWCKPAVNAAMKPDVLMELMQLYCDVKTSLTSVLSALPDDIAWHLNAVLCAVPGLSLRLSTKANAVLTRHYLSHLVADRNLLAQALYVAMTMPDDVEREATAKAILQRHITASTPRTPLEALVPSPWIEDALALYALAEQQYDAAVEHYLRAGAWTAAHDVLIHHVVFPAMIHQDTTWVHLVLEAHLAPRAQDIAQWAAYGNVVLTYLNLRRTRDNATMESVVALCDRLHQWQTKPLHVLSDNAIEASAVARACLSSMLAYTTEVAVLLQPSGPGSSSARHWFDRLQTFVQPDAFGESFRAALLVRACAAFD